MKIQVWAVISFLIIPITMQAMLNRAKDIFYFVQSKSQIVTEKVKRQQFVFNTWRANRAYQEYQTIQRDYILWKKFKDQLDQEHNSTVHEIDRFLYQRTHGHNEYPLVIFLNELEKSKTQFATMSTKIETAYSLNPNQVIEQEFNIEKNNEQKAIACIESIKDKLFSDKEFTKQLVKQIQEKHMQESEEDSFVAGWIIVLLVALSTTSH